MVTILLLVNKLIYNAYIGQALKWSGSVQLAYANTIPPYQATILVHPLHVGIQVHKPILYFCSHEAGIALSLISLSIVVSIIPDFGGTTKKKQWIYVRIDNQMNRKPFKKDTKT